MPPKYDCRDFEFLPGTPVNHIHEPRALSPDNRDHWAVAETTPAGDTHVLAVDIGTRNEARMLASARERWRERISDLSEFTIFVARYRDLEVPANQVLF